MKTIPQILGLLLAPFFCFSQNWNLISSDRTLNFGAAGNDQVVAKSILVEAASDIGADSFYRVGPRALRYLSSYPYVVQVGNFLADSIVRKSNGLCEFHFTEPSQPGLSDLIEPPFFIRALALPGESWVFQDTILAQVTSVEAQTVLGVSDSVKTILLSDGDTILLSKAFGLLKFRDYTLIGLQGTGSGAQLPDNLDWYDWAPGEVFQYENFSGNNYDLSYKTWTKYTVQAKTLSPEAITFTVRRLTKLETYQFNVLHSTTYEDVIEPFVVPNPTLVDYPGYTPVNACTYRSCTYMLSGSAITKVIDQIQPPCSSDPQASSTYTAGLGRTQNYFNYNSLGGGYYTNEHLIGYLKSGQAQQGAIHPNSFYNALSDVDTPKVGEGPKVFPNPARGQATVQCVSSATVSSIVLFDAAGQKMRDFQAGTSRVELPIADLPTGVYFLKIQSGGGSGVRKLVIEGY